jgi:hypothetical protein
MIAGLYFLVAALLFAGCLAEFRVRNRPAVLYYLLHTLVWPIGVPIAIFTPTIEPLLL